MAVTIFAAFVAIKFYLNYEGCKDISFVPQNFSLTKFYLNYEGCKDGCHNICGFRGYKVLSEL